MDDSHIDPQRLWKSLMDMAAIGATPAGGCRRLALTDEDKAGRDLFIAWAKDAGCGVTVDRMGNIFARRPGTEQGSAPVLAGSHLDTQPTGGKFDGPLGVLTALEAVRTLNDKRISTRRPVEIAVWTNEEGSRFQPACTGSAVFAGALSEEEAFACVDGEGLGLGDELERIGHKGGEPCGGRPVHAYLEVHIEQGPVLENEGLAIAAVTGIQGKKALRVRVGGVNAHAGTTPMEVRRDPLLGAARMVQQVDRLTRAARPDAVATVGSLRVDPGSINVINREVNFTIDLRCPDDATLVSLDGAFRDAAQAIAGETGLELDYSEISFTPTVTFDERMVAAVEKTAEALALSCRRLMSGAGHDAKFLSRVCQTGMIFVPCEGGLSHNEAENISLEQAAAGARVLLHALRRLADEP
jgi:N-carbamoyl-L-amino-acid hydrolase